MILTCKEYLILNIQKKRVEQLCTLFILVLLAALLCGFSPASGHSDSAFFLTRQPESGQLTLYLTADDSVNGWEKDGVVYFFLPSYASADQIVLNAGLKWDVAGASAIDLQYDIPLELLCCNEQGKIAARKHVCFKHSANLHTIYMNLTDGGLDSITKDAFVDADIKVVNPMGQTEYSSSGNSVKGRGNSTWDLEKKPYFIKLKEKAGLCGMEPSRKWLLLANAYEATKLSNKLFYDFSKEAGLAFSTDSQWADLYINGEYRGNYLICEKIDVGTGRINISDLEQENETAAPGIPSNITGGYIIEKDVSVDFPDQGFVTANNNCFVLTSPDNASPEEIAYIRDCFQNVENLLGRRDEQVLQYIDAESFARRFLIEETALNSDAFITSCYFYKKRNDNRIYAGPIWDFDSVLGESDTVDREEMGNVWLNYDETTVLSMDRNRATTAVLPWDEQLYEIPAYQTLVKEAYIDLLPLLETLLYDRIDASADQIRQSVILDSFRWNYGENEAGHYSSFDSNVRYLKFFLAKRINFLNRRFGIEELPYEDIENGFHKVTCMTKDGAITFSVKDGSPIRLTDLPAYDEEAYSAWIYEWDLTPVSEYLPVYEDITLLLR